MSKSAPNVREHHRWSYPAREFEAAVGIRGLRGGWVLPDWLDTTHRRSIFRYGDKKLAKIWDQLGELNPRIDGLVGPQFLHLRHYVLGVLSDLNRDDIDFFVALVKQDRLFSSGIEVVGNSNQLAPDFTEGAFCLWDVRPQWRVSGKTFERIRDGFYAATGRVGASRTMRLEAA